jgi:photosystem II stability/assembly factor-like uncharacterized protein
MRLAFLLAILLSITAFAEDHVRAPQLTPQQSGTTQRLQAISPVNDKVVWASGLGGTFVRTADGGRHWHSGVVPGAENLQFRDVEGVSARVAYLLASGSGTDSRIYKTEDGGKSWTVQFVNQDPLAFYDCFSFWTPERGITTSDSVSGRFPAIRTTNGETWHDIGNNMPTALVGEAMFAASGTCIATQGERRAWIGTGGAKDARVLFTSDGGNTWSAHDTPVVQGTPSSGILSIAFRDARHGIIGAGELAIADKVIGKTIATSSDGGRTWHLRAPVPFVGSVFGLSYTHKSGEGDDEHGGRTVVATGPGGTAWTPDEGGHWHNLASLQNFWAVAFADAKSGWLVGTDGRIVKITFDHD